MRETIRVVVKNRTTTFMWPYPVERLRMAFAFQPDGFRFMPSFRRGIWDGYIRLLKYNRLPTGLFFALKDEVEQKENVRFEVQYQLQPVQFHSVPTDGRDYQLECVATMQKAAQLGGGLILCATGTGKTRSAGLFFRSTFASCVFIVDELTLLEQARKELATVVGEHIGIIGHSEWQTERITVATVQSLHKHSRKPEFQAWARQVELMIIDELHVAMARRNFTVVETMKPKAVFGLTATLQIQKQSIRMRAFAIAGPVVFQYSLREGTREGHLTQGAVVQVVVETHIVKNETTDWTAAYRQLTNSKERNTAITQLVRAAVERGRSVVVLVEWIQHIKTLSHLLRDIPHRLVYGEVEVEDRIDAKQQFESGEVQLLIANRVFSRGINLLKVDCIIDASAMKSKNSCVQKFGRGVRLCVDKIGLVYFDICDIGNQFESASISRKQAFIKIKIPVYRVPYNSYSVQKIVARSVELVDGVKKQRAVS